MAKFNCKCGHIINLSEGRAECEFALVPEQRIEKIGDLLANDKKVTDEQFFDLVDEVKITVYRCPVCHRLYLENKLINNKFDTYEIEN